MKLTILSGLAVSLLAFTGPSSKINEPYPKIEKYQKLLWKTKTGNACFRTNIEQSGNNIIFGSNGQYFLDATIWDKESGVYVLDKSTGRVVSTIGDDVIGDMDVAGILLYNNKLYYGNDNEEFICATLDGKEVWRNVASGDIEHQPSLIKNGNQTYIVYASELGEVRAVDAETGKRIWSYYTPKFDGWKEGDNRIIFKVRAFVTGTESFYTKPSLVDVNKDGVLDLIYISYGGDVYVISGINGKLLWFYDNKVEARTSFGNILQENNNAIMLISAYSYNHSLMADEYYLLRLDLTNRVVTKEKFSNSSFKVSALNSYQNKNTIVYPGVDSIFIYKDHQIISAIPTGDSMYHDQAWYENKIGPRYFGHLVLGTNTFTYYGQNNCFALLCQRDNANYEHGVLEIVDPSNKKVLARYTLPAASEMPPLITDVNNDGKKEVIINCLDNYTYCFQLEK